MADQTSHNAGQPDIAVQSCDEQLTDFLDQLFEGSLPRFASFSFTIDSTDPLAYLEMNWNNTVFQYCWEKPADEFAMAAGRALHQISASGPNRFEKIDAQYQSIKESTAQYAAIAHPYAGMIFLGGFSFFDEIADPIWQAFEPAAFTIPEWMIVKDGKFNIATLCVQPGEFNSPDSLQQYLQQQLHHINRTIDGQSTAITDDTRPLDQVDTKSLHDTTGHAPWITSIGKAKELISENRFQKIVLARRLSAPLRPEITPTAVLNSLRQQYTSCYNFLLHHPSGPTFLGSTPERLGAFRNQLLLTEALAGSIQRGNTASEDAMLERQLSNSSKDRSEHQFVIRDIEERLRPYVNNIQRSDSPTIKKLSNVQHLYTPIRAHLKPDVSMLEVIGHLHPTPAVGGYPWKKASSYIKELEYFDRGWYAGPLGWFNTKGNGEFAVGIRSGLFTEDQAHFFAGCGIVADSDPEAEWKETNLKLKPILSALQYD